jgi:hypothetical protein
MLSSPEWSECERENNVLDIPDGTINLSMRSFLFIAFVCAFSSFSIADPPTVDSLPTPVANTLKAQAANGTIRNIETFQWGDSTIYKIAIDQNGQPYLELQIADTGRLVRVDQLAPEMSDTDEDDGASPTPSPSASPR